MDPSWNEERERETHPWVLVRDLDMISPLITTRNRHSPLLDSTISS